jgi:hypothetical protein
MFDLTYLSLGGGVQSSALLVCSALGLHGVPKADVAIFADTGDEIKDTYDHIDWLEAWAKPHGIPLHRVSQGHLGKELVGEKKMARRGVHVSIPAFTAGDVASEGVLRRQCTKEYKLEPIRREVRRVLGFQKGERIAGKKRARALIGISLDEAIRMKESRDKWVANTYPLVDARITRQGCERILREHVVPIPVKSACRFCPYHDDSYWKWLKEQRPGEFEQAAVTDDKIRDLTRAGVERPVFLHRSCKPLREIDFDERIKGHRDQMDLDGFGNECEGMCGV